MTLKVGDIYWYPVRYPTTGLIEVRPVVIIEIKDDTTVFATFAEITGSKIKSIDGKFDKWKVPLFKWDEYGMEKGSYAKANCVAQVPATSFQDKKYMGTMHRTDLANVCRTVEEFIESGETPW